MLPFFKPKKGFQFAGSGLDAGSGGGGGGGAGDIAIVSNTEYETPYTYNGKRVYGFLYENTTPETWNNTGIMTADHFWLMNYNYYDSIGGEDSCLNMPANKNDNFNYINKTSLGVRVRVDSPTGKAISVLIYYTKTTD